MESRIFKKTLNCQVLVSIIFPMGPKLSLFDRLRTCAENRQWLEGILSDLEKPINRLAIQISEIHDSLKGE